MLLVAIALSVSLALGAPGPLPSPALAESPRSQLPATQPGLSRNEGVFLITAADDGSRLVYFIAQNTRHNTLPGDLQLEQSLNSLWPVRIASRDEVLAFAEAAPVGSARTGLLSGPVAAQSDSLDEAPAVAEEPVVAEAPVVAEEPVVAEAPVVAEEPVVAETPVADEAPAVEEAPVVVEVPIVARAPAAAPGPVAVSMPSAADPAVYVLRSGDNLTRISAKYSTTIPAILAANGLTNANRIYVGQALIIPGFAPAPEEILAAPVTAPASAIVESPAAPQPVASDEPEAVADVPSVDAMTYTVKAGDSATHIARQFGVDLDKLLTANGVVNRNRVYVGQVLDIPGA